MGLSLNQACKTLMIGRARRKDSDSRSNTPETASLLLDHKLISASPTANENAAPTSACDVSASPKYEQCLKGSACRGLFNRVYAMRESKKVIVALDLPPQRAHGKTRDSFEAAARRWGATMFWLREPLADCHPYWQKLLVCNQVLRDIGHCHVLQLDTDMLIRDDCPSLFDLVPKDHMGLVACRQGNFDLGGATSWVVKAQDYWAKRLNMVAAPGWAHPNGGIYLYHTAVFGEMFAEIASKGESVQFDHRNCCDESIIINYLWDRFPNQISFLPGEFNTVLHHNPHLVANKPMHSYIYHFVGNTKPHLPSIWWQRGKNPPLPIQSAPHAHVAFRLIREIQGEVRKGVEVGVFHGATAASLLALLPNVELYGVDAWETYSHDNEQPRPDHVQQISDTKTLFWGLPIALRTVSVNGQRWKPIRLPSLKAARCFDDGEVDFVFIDADHSYEAASSDIAAWLPKIRRGGLLLGHDYMPGRFPGVCRAVDELEKMLERPITKSQHFVWSVKV